MMQVDTVQGDLSLDSHSAMALQRLATDDSLRKALRESPKEVLAEMGFDIAGVHIPSEVSLPKKADILDLSPKGNQSFWAPFLPGA